MNRDAFASWLNAYVEAWKTYDPESIGALFAADAVYRFSPSQKSGISGRAAIVKSWLDNRDEPGTYDAAYEPLAIDGDVYVGSGVSRYFEQGGALRDEYHNVYVCRFNAAGECTDFTEYWIQNGDFRKRDRDELIRKAKAGEV